MLDKLSFGDLAPYLPPAVGALIGLRYAKDQSPTQKVSSFALGVGLGVYGGAGLAEWLSLGPKGTAGMGILVAALGYDALGGCMAAIGQFKENPVQTGRRWINAWFGRSDQ
jgi:hypothetical protein